MPETGAAGAMVGNGATPSSNLPAIPATIDTRDPGPQSWPNANGPRPTLSQGLAAPSSMMGMAGSSTVGFERSSG